MKEQKVDIQVGLTQDNLVMLIAHLDDGTELSNLPMTPHQALEIAGWIIHTVYLGRAMQQQKENETEQ